MRYPPLLIALFIAFLVKPFTMHFSLLALPESSFMILIFGATIYAFRHQRTLVRYLVILGVGALILRLVAGPGERTTTSIISHALSFVMMVVVMIAILGEVLRARTASTDLVVGAVCLYLVIGLGWAFLYYWLFLLSPGSIFVSPAIPANLGPPASEPRFAEVLYYSLSALTTIGSSGEEPMTTMTRQLAVVESTMGQLYLAVLVSRLVGFSTSNDTKGP